MKNEIIGLNLLFLIVENRMADFHSEVKIPSAILYNYMDLKWTGLHCILVGASL